MRHRGFSLVELMVVIVVVGLVLAIGVPAFSGMSATLRHREAREELLQRLRGARQAAVTRHRAVRMTFGDSLTTGITSYTVHVDVNGDGAVQSTEPVSAYTLPRDCSLATSGFSPVNTLVFDPSGALAPGTSGGRLFVSGTRGPDTLEVAATGMVYRP